MEIFSRLCGVAAPFFQSNVDTGALAPAQWNRDHPDDLGTGLFRNWRFDAEGKEKPDFVLNQSRYRDCKILVAGPNFGCGSSRETAVWALLKYGIKCVIAPSFGEIFYDNAFQNGLLPVTVPLQTIEALIAALQTRNDPTLCVDLEAATIEMTGCAPIGFAIPPDRKIALLEGLDETMLLRRSEVEIAAFQAKDEQKRPWIYEEVPCPDNS